MQKGRILPSPYNKGSTNIKKCPARILSQRVLIFLAIQKGIFHPLIRGRGCLQGSSRAPNPLATGSIWPMCEDAESCYLETSWTLQETLVAMDSKAFHEPCGFSGARFLLTWCSLKLEYVCPASASLLTSPCVSTLQCLRGAQQPGVNEK